VIRALAFMVVLGGVTILSIVELAAGDPDWLTWVMLVAGPVGMVAAVGEYLDARKERR
jgi:hypothetical protein